MTEYTHGYIFLNKREQEAALEFFKRNGSLVPDIDEGGSIAGKRLILGLNEDPITGRLIIPNHERKIGKKRLAIQVSRLNEIEWKIWILHCNGDSQARIALRLGIGKSSVCRSLAAIESKIQAARERNRKSFQMVNAAKAS